MTTIRRRSADDDGDDYPHYPRRGRRLRPGAARVADYLVTEMRNDGLVVNGTTGEAPTTTDAEKSDCSGWYSRR